MSLEKHYAAAREAYGHAWREATDDPDYGHEQGLRAAVNAALSSLADDPPEEMVDAMIDCQNEGESDAREILTAALREAGKGNDDG